MPIEETIGRKGREGVRKEGRKKEGGRRRKKEEEKKEEGEKKKEGGREPGKKALYILGVP